MMNILVAYASAHGSTAQVALKIGQVLGEKGVNAVVANVKDVRSIHEFDGVILGSAIHNGTVLKEMNSFIRAFANELRSKHIYLWLSCIRVLEQYGEGYVLDHYLDHKLLNPLRILDIAVFAGKLDLATVDWDERWALAVRYDGGTWPSNFDGDYRDWNKIHVWAGQVAAELSLLKPVQNRVTR
jgi:menaquinone-dependent protoporphyrinogen oxidase